MNYVRQKRHSRKLCSSSQRRFVLVTGTHRSGTTWVGNVLSSAPGTRYLHEPFNIDHPGPNNELNLRFWFQHFDPDDRAAVSAMNKLLRNATASDMTARLSGWPYAAASRIEFWTRRLRRRYPTTIMKDPIALLSSEWLEKQFDAYPVVMIRHPASFVASLKLKHWFFDFQQLLNQPSAVHRFFPDEIERMEKVQRDDQGDIIKVGATLWRVLHRAIARLQEQHPHWMFIRLEDVSNEPTETFHRMFDLLGFDFTDATRRFITDTTSTSDIAYEKNSTAPCNIVRNSRNNNDLWNKRLDEREIETIRSIVCPFSDHYYSDEYW